MKYTIEDLKEGDRVIILKPSLKELEENKQARNWPFWNPWMDVSVARDQIVESVCGKDTHYYGHFQCNQLPWVWHIDWVVQIERKMDDGTWRTVLPGDSWVHNMALPESKPTTIEVSWKPWEHMGRSKETDVKRVDGTGVYNLEIVWETPESELRKEVERLRKEAVHRERRLADLSRKVKNQRKALRDMNKVVQHCSYIIDAAVRYTERQYAD